MRTRTPCPLGRSRDRAASPAPNELGVIYKTWGEPHEAEKMLRKALAINERLGRQDGMAQQYGNLGLIYRKRGNPDEAEKMLCEALEVFERIGARESMATQYGNLGLIYAMRGKLDEAREFAMKARDLYAGIGMPHMVRRVQDLLDELDAEHPSSGPATRSGE